METTPDRRRPEGQVSRSWLLLSAQHPDAFLDAHESAADQLILDLEDGVDSSNKCLARQQADSWLRAGSAAWVRINPRASEFWLDDIERLREAPGLRGVMLAKTESAGEVEDTVAAFGSDIPIIALIESARGVESAVDIAGAEGAFRLAFGSGDYRRDTGTAATDLAMAYPRTRLVIASTIAGLPGPIDGPTVSAQHAVLRAQSELAVSLGMTGKLCLDMDHLTVLNESFSPTRSDLLWAHDFIVDFEARGRVVKDGSDLPRLGRAQEIVALARDLGTFVEE